MCGLWSLDWFFSFWHFFFSFDLSLVVVLVFWLYFLAWYLHWNVFSQLVLLVYQFVRSLGRIWVVFLLANWHTYLYFLIAKWSYKTVLVQRSDRKDQRNWVAKRVANWYFLSLVIRTKLYFWTVATSDLNCFTVSLALAKWRSSTSNLIQRIDQSVSVST